MPIVYGLFCVRVGKLFYLYVMFCNWMYALKVLGLSFDLLEYLVMTHIDRLKLIL
jgi:hypothetical protein